MSDEPYRMNLLNQHMQLNNIWRSRWLPQLDLGKQKKKDCTLASFTDVELWFGVVVAETDPEHKLWHKIFETLACKEAGDIY